MRLTAILPCRCLLGALLLFGFGAAQAQAQGQDSMAGVGFEAIGQPIDQFIVTGNDTTQEEYLLHWAGLYPGQILTINVLQHALQELRDTELFKTIQFRAERHENGELTLHIIVEERIYWLILPRASRNSDGDIKWGFRLRLNNLQGADRTLDILAQREQEADGDDSDEVRMAYKLPMISKPYDLEWALAQVVEHNEEEGFKNVETVNYFAFSVARDWHLDLFETPLKVETGINFRDRSLDKPYPEDIDAREAGSFNALRLSLIFDDRHSERYRRFGSYYGISIDQGFSALGSDYESTIVEFVAINYHRLNFYDNLNTRFVIEASNNSPFDYPQFSIGGGSSVRGLESVDDRGDARWFANVDLVLSYKKAPQFAHTFFVDFGNVYENLGELDFGDLYVTVGTGLRWKLESFVKTDLFLDYGWDIEEQEGKLYGGTSLNF